MDDVIYYNMKKNIIMPLNMATVRHQLGEKSISLDDIKLIGNGTVDFLSSF